MTHLFRKIIILLSMGIIIPFFLTFTAFYGFSSNYTTNVFSLKSMQDQYSIGIYRFRILGPLLLKSHFFKLKEVYSESPPQSRRLRLLDQDGDEVFYYAYFQLHAFFLCAFSVLQLLWFNSSAFRISESEAIMATLAFQSLTALSFFVITPYDPPVLFLTAAALMLMTHSNRWIFLAGCALLVLGVFFRESIALAVSFFLATLIAKKGIRNIFNAVLVKSIRAWLAIAAFVIPYIFLRLAFGMDFAQSFTFYENIKPPDLYALYFALALFGTLLLIQREQSTKVLLYFLVLSLPYLIALLMNSRLIEFRLVLPVFYLGALATYWNVDRKKSAKKAKFFEIFSSTH